MTPSYFLNFEMGRLNIIKVKTEYEENGGSPSNDNLCLMTIANGCTVGSFV